MILTGFAPRRYVLVWVFRLFSLAVLYAAEDVVVDSDVFYDFHDASTLRAMAVYCQAVNSFLNWFALVRFLSYIPRYKVVGS